MPLEAAARGASLVIAGLFFLGALHKGHLIMQGRAAAQPLMRLTPWRRKHARLTLAAAGTLEIGVATLLLIHPLGGFLGAVALLLFYAAELRRLPEHESCNCFGAFLSEARSRAIRRNLVVCALSAAGALAYASNAAETREIAQLSLGVALVMMALLAAHVAVGRLPQAPAPNPESVIEP